MKTKIKTVGIIGGGPSGATLASLLALRGVDVTIFDDGRRPALVVGESLVPAIIPVLRRLGIEERVAQIGVHKPGVSFTFAEGADIDFNFNAVTNCALPTYAYNVPRPAFDALIDERATELGVKRAKVHAKVERVGANSLRLAPESLAHAPWLNGREPDLLVDSTGRSRLFARTMEIPSEAGPRRDTAHFAHYEGFEEKIPRGTVIIGQLQSGWSWRIPLRDRLSVGVVVPKDELAKLGSTPEERLEAAIARDPALSAAGVRRRRISEVVSYTNYQLVSARGHGPGWAMTGDAFGFVDPMLSPGLWLALRSAELLADNLDHLPSYSKQVHRLIKAWMDLIAYYYDGRMFAMYHTGKAFEEKYPGKISAKVHTHIEGQIACMASGATTTSWYGRGMLKMLSSSHGTWGKQPEALAIR